MQRLNTLNKTYESGEVLYNDNLNLIIDYINQSINAINELMISNDVNVGHYEIRYKDSLSEPSPPSAGSSGLSDGWKRSIDSAVYNIWMTQCFVTIGNTYGTWTKAVKISSKDGNNGSFILEVYRNDSATSVDNAYIPEVIDNDYSSPAFPPTGWTTTILTRAEGEYTWCILRTVSFNRNNDSIYGKWSVPFRVTGDNGKDGEDGKYLEYIYKRFTSKQTWQQTDSNPATWSISDTLFNILPGQKNRLNPQREDYIGPSELGWTDNPQGVDETNKYEYACQRIYDGKSYGAFTSPVLWSKYGDKGRDGDGVEYIFWGRTEAVTDWNAFSLDSQNLVNYPPSWTNNEGFQNDEYFGPDGSSWVDDALGIDDIRRYIYMSKRKKIQDPLTRISSWDSFSIPVLWNLYGGTTSFTSNIFKRSPTKPNKPGANEGSFLNPVPTGWSDGIPAGTDSIWITSRIFSSNGQYPQQEEWSNVQLMSDTESFDVEFSPIESNPGTPTTNPNNWYDPTTDTNANWTNMIWMATRTKSNGVWGNWNVTKIKGEKGDPGTSSTFDDTELRNAISTLNNTVAGEKSRLDGVINNLNNSIQTEVESLLDDATWVQNNFPEGSGSSSNFGQQDVENYLQTIGVWSNDEVHNKTNAAWSKISLSVSEITSRVATLETNGIDTQSLSSTINQKIANGEIQLNLDNTYARKTTVDEVEQIIEWMYSGLRTSTGQDKTIAQLTAAGKSGLTSAIADIRTQVNKLENGDYVATASVDAKVKDSISGMLATADSTTAAGLFFSSVGSALTAGLITEANLSTKAASAGLLAENLLTGKVAAILATVGRNGSNITLDADQLNITSDFINAMNASLSVASVTTELILAAIADGLIIKAGKVNFQKADGTAAPISINVNDGTLQAENAALTGTFTSSSDLSKIIINTLTRTEQYDPNAILNTVSSSIQMLAYNNMTYNENDDKIEKTAQSLLVDVLTIGVNEVFLLDDSGSQILDVGYDGMIRINSTASSGRVATFSPENISCSDGYGSGASLAYGTIRASGFSRKLSALEKISYTLDSTFIPNGTSKYTLSMGFSSSGGSGLLAIRTESAPYANKSTTLFGTYGADMLVLSEKTYNNSSSRYDVDIYTTLVAGEDARLEFDDGTPDGKIVIGIDGIRIGTDWSITWSQFKSKLNQI